MEVLEFVKQKKRMCDYYDDGCTRDGSGEICPAHNMNCVLAANMTECLVAVVEQWAKEHREKPGQERQKPGQERQKPEQGVVGCLDPGTFMEVLGFMKQRKRMCDYYGDDSCVCDDSRGECPALDMDCSFTTDHPEHLIAIVEQWAKEHPEKPEQKRTNKDVLLAAFPDAYVYPGGVPLACPLSLDKHYECSKFKNCEDCRTTHWPADAE